MHQIKAIIERDVFMFKDFQINDLWLRETGF